MGQVADILLELPGSVAPSKYIPWLREEILPFIQEADQLASIKEWIHDRALDIEQREKAPHNALELIQLLNPNASQNKALSLFVPVTPSSFTLKMRIHHNESCDQDDSSETQTCALQKQLEDLVYLWASVDDVD
jgi:hypothetical protein